MSCFFGLSGVLGFRVWGLGFRVVFRGFRVGGRVSGEVKGVLGLGVFQARSFEGSSSTEVQGLGPRVWSFS